MSSAQRPRVTGLITRTCEQCSADFLVQRSQVTAGGGKYCSRACYVLSLPGRTWIGKAVYTCPQCSAEVREWSSQVRPGNVKYCSRACSILGRRRPADEHFIRTVEAARRGRAVLQPRPCAQCGTTFRPRADAGEGHGLYCSQRCANVVNRSKRPNWGVDGRRFVDRYVKVRMPDHPAASKGGYVYEHRVVMERVLGRLLTSDEHVHHINHVKTDNRPENLEVVSKAEHLKHHRPDHEETRVANLRAAYARKFPKPPP
jgi:endogenous inhibitor of DNA gyrase (YacG/DUF329 family)